MTAAGGGVKWVRARVGRADGWPLVRAERPEGGAAALNDAEMEAYELLARLALGMAAGRAIRLGEAYDAAGLPRPPHSLLMHDVSEECRVGDVHSVAGAVGLPGGHRHWLVDLLLAEWGAFYSHGGGDCYLTAEAFLRYADDRDLADAELVGLARAMCRLGVPN